MKENLEILIIPDVHGRDFWREPVKDVLENSDKPVIFLGDYLDPYSYEWEGTGVDCQEYCVEVFKDILELKKKYGGERWDWAFIAAQGSTAFHKPSCSLVKWSWHGPATPMLAGLKALPRRGLPHFTRYWRRRGRSNP